MSKKIIYLILVLVSLLVGFFVGKISERKIWQAKIIKTQKEIEFLESSLEMFYPPLPEEVYSISGKVTEVGDKTISIETLVRVSQFPLAGGAEIEKQNIKVNITDQTKIIKIEMPVIPPFSEEEIPEKIVSFSDIKVGDQISVTSEENIKGEKEITASQIRIISELF